MRLISRIAQSSAAAICWCIAMGSSPSTKRGSQPQPRKKLSTSPWLMREKMVGLAILKPLRCKIGSTAPSVIGFMNLFPCHEVAKRSCLRLAVADHAGGDQIGIVRHRAEGVGEEVAQLTALVNGAGGLRRHMARDAAGERKRLKSLCMPSLSRVMLG